MKCNENEKNFNNKILQVTFEKWKTCQTSKCSINISNSWRELAHCNMCKNYWVEGMPIKKDFSDWIKDWRRNNF